MLTFLYVYVGRIEQGTFDESKEAYTTWIQMVCHSKFIFATCVPLNESYDYLEKKLLVHIREMMIMDVSFGQAHSVIGEMKSLAAKHLNRMDPAAAIVEELVEASTRSQNGNIRFTYEFQICNIHLLYIYM